MSIIKQNKAGLLFGNFRDPKMVALDRQLKIAFSEIKSDIELQNSQITKLKEEIKSLKEKIQFLEKENIKITPLMNDILELIKIKPMNSRELFLKLQSQGKKIHEKSIPRSIKSLVDIGKINKKKEGKIYIYSNNPDSTQEQIQIEE